MDISLTMLLDLALPKCAPVIGSSAPAETDDPDTTGKGDRELPTGAPLLVRGVRIFDNARSVKTKNNSDLLFVRRQPGGVVFYHRDRKIPFETELSFAEVFNKLEEAFIILRDWDMKLHQGIIENKGLQYMLDVSEDIFRHPMAITDSAYKMIAYSKHRQGPDFIFQTGVEKGYLSSDAISELDKAGYIFEIKAIVYRKGIEGLSDPMLNGTVFVEQNYRYMLTVLFPDDDYSEGIYDLFAFMLEQLTLYVETNGDALRIRRFAWLSLLTDLADGKCGQPEFAERNQYSGLPENLQYRVLSARRKDGRMREFFRDRLEMLLPGEIVFDHGDSAHALITERTLPDISQMNETLMAVADGFDDKTILLSVSNGFGTLCDLHEACLQTMAAYSLGLRISQNRTLEIFGIASREYDTNLFLYSDYYPYDLISGSCALVPEFCSLLHEDIKTGAGNLRLLYSYLKNDCSKTRTAADLFMHRNSIIYRIRKLEDTLALSFADERIKNSLRLSFLALELTDPESLLPPHI